MAVAGGFSSTIFHQAPAIGAVVITRNGCRQSILVHGMVTEFGQHLCDDRSGSGMVVLQVENVVVNQFSDCDGFDLDRFRDFTAFGILHELVFERDSFLFNTRLSGTDDSLAVVPELDEPCAT